MNVKNLKKHPGGVLLLVARNFTKSNTPSWMFFMFLELCEWYQIVQSIQGYDQKIRGCDPLEHRKNVSTLHSC